MAALWAAPNTGNPVTSDLQPVVYVHWREREQSDDPNISRSPVLSHAPEELIDLSGEGLF